MKEKYNKLLKRYYTGCTYIKEHPKEQEKYLPEVLKILKEMNEILDKIENKTTEEILEGLKI